jgi:hypothetical protein
MSSSASCLEERRTDWKYGFSRAADGVQSLSLHEQLAVWANEGGAGGDDEDLEDRIVFIGIAGAESSAGSTNVSPTSLNSVT